MYHTSQIYCPCNVIKRLFGIGYACAAIVQVSEIHVLRSFKTHMPVAGRLKVTEG